MQASNLVFWNKNNSFNSNGKRMFYSFSVPLLPHEHGNTLYQEQFNTNVSQIGETLPFLTNNLT
jgi:cellobiose phosphorylase